MSQTPEPPGESFAVAANADWGQQLCAEINALRREVAELRQQVGYWKAQHQRARQREDQLRLENDQLRATCRDLRRQRFGRSSEKASAADSAQQLQQAGDPDAVTTSTPRPRGQQPQQPGPRRRRHPQLPVVVERHELQTAQQVCPRCQAPWVANGTTPTDTLEVEVRAYRRRVQRQRYQRTCQCAACPLTTTTPLPAQLLPKGSLGLSVWVEVLLGKFLLQQPLERQLQHWRLLGLDLAAGTVTDGLRRLVPLFEPLYQALRERCQQATFPHGDETRWLVFIEQTGKTGHTWWLWLFLSVDTVCSTLDPFRSHDTPEAHFAEAQDTTLMVDRYSAYQAMATVKDGAVRLAFCWAHVRRDFVQVGKSWPALTEWALTWLRRIRDLYLLQRERLTRLPGSAMQTEVESRLRQHLERLHDQAGQDLAAVPVHPAVAKTLRSLLGHWSGLTRFVADPRVPLDNNVAERQLRNPVVGRKNYYGSGALWSGRLATMLFSLFATLQKWQVNPRRWLEGYLASCATHGGRVPAQAVQWLPWYLSPEQRRQWGACADDTS